MAGGVVIVVIFREPREPEPRFLSSRREFKQRESRAAAELNVEAEEKYVAIFHFVLFAFKSVFAGFFHRGFRLQSEKII